MYCENCGTKLENDTKYCHNCGESVLKDVATTSSISTSSSTKNDKIKATIKCDNCDYVGRPELGRTKAGVILAWLCIFITPLITITYFIVTHKYKCPKCKSSLLNIKNKEGVWQKAYVNNTLVTVLKVIVAIAVVGIISSIILVSLHDAREKANKAQYQGIGIN